MVSSVVSIRRRRISSLRLDGPVSWKGGGLWLEIIVVVGIGGLGLLGTTPGHTKRGLSDGVVSEVVGGRKGGRANGSSVAPSGLHAVRRQLVTEMRDWFINEQHSKSEVDPQVCLIVSRSFMTCSGSSCSFLIKQGMNSACLRIVPARVVEVSSYNCSNVMAFNTFDPLRLLPGRDCCIFATVT